MNKKIVALTLVLLLTTIYATSLSVLPAKAQGTGWLTSYDIYDANSNEHLASYSPSTGNQSLAPIVPGAEIKVVFTVDVFTPGSGDLKLATSLQAPPQGQYWQLSSGSAYTLGSDFNPDASPASFNWVQGTFTMTLIGTVPTPSGSATQASLAVVTLYGPTSGLPLDSFTVPEISAALTQFQVIYNDRVNHVKSLESQGAAQGYIDLYNNVLNQSVTEANSGDVTNAIALLNSMNISNEPVSQASTVDILLPLAGVFAALAVVFVVMFFRVRGKVSYFQLVVEDQIKDLEGLTLRASKIDRAMASNLDSVKDRLKRLVGM